MIETACQEAGGVVAGLERLRTHGYARLRPIEPGRMNALSALVATWHIGDPVGSGDAWRPWARRAALRHCLERHGLPASAVRLVPEH